MVVCLSFLSGKKQLIKAEKKGFPSFLVQKKGETRVSGYRDMKKSKKMSRDTVLRDMKEDVRSLITDLTTRYQIIGKSLKLLKMTGEPSFYADSPIADEEEKYDESVEHLKKSVMEFQRYCSVGPYRELIEKYIPDLRETTDEDELKSIYQKWTADLNKLKVDCNFMHRNLVTEIQQMLQFVRHLKAKEMESMDEAAGFGRDLNRIHNEERVMTMYAYENEISTLYESVTEMSSESAWMFLEGADDSVKEGFVKKLIRKIAELKDKVLSFISDFYNKHFTKKMEEDVTEAIKNDPEIKKKKVKVRDWKKMEQLQEDAMNAVDDAKTTAEVDDAVRKYKKKRAVIIGSSIAIAVTAALGIIHHNRKNSAHKINKKNKKMTQTMSTLESEIAASRADIKITGEGSTKTNPPLIRKKMVAVATFTSDAYADEKEQLQELNTALKKCGVNGKLSVKRGTNNQAYDGNLAMVYKTYDPKIDAINKKIGKIELRDNKAQLDYDNAEKRGSLPKDASSKLDKYLSNSAKEKKVLDDRRKALMKARIKETSYFDIKHNPAVYGDDDTWR